MSGEKSNQNQTFHHTSVLRRIM